MMLNLNGPRCSIEFCIIFDKGNVLDEKRVPEYIDGFESVAIEVL